MIIKQMHCKKFYFKIRTFRNTIFNIFLAFRCAEKKITIYPADVVLFEGILVFYFQSIRNLFHMKLFVDTDSDTRLARRGRCFF